MKNIITSLVITFATTVSPMLMAESPTQGQSPPPGKKVSAPNGGRLIATVDANIEFLVAADRKIKVFILDKDRKTTAATDQSASAVCGDRMNPTNLSFSVQGGVLVSDKPLPEGQSLPIILKFKSAKESPYKAIKFTINFEKCGSCDKPEYACSCDCEGH
jgi:hypothetical protein